MFFFLSLSLSGTVGSAKLLLQSGVGSSDHLERVGVHPRLHLPGVGRNLQDHLFALFDVAVEVHQRQQQWQTRCLTGHPRVADRCFDCSKSFAVAISAFVCWGAGQVCQVLVSLR